MASVITPIKNTMKKTTTPVVGAPSAIAPKKTPVERRDHNGADCADERAPVDSRFRAGDDREYA